MKSIVNSILLTVIFSLDAKTKLFFLFILLSSVSQATNYYIKTGGNDAADGKSDKNAWGSITHLNAVWAAKTFAPGDSILFRKGDTFAGTITVAESGAQEL